MPRAYNNARGPAWTAAEDKLLMQIYGRTSKAEYLKAFPGRTYEAVKGHAKWLKIKAPQGSEDFRRRRLQSRDAWSLDEIEVVLLYGRSDRDKCLELLTPKRNAAAIRKMCSHLSIFVRENGPKWSNDEERLVQTIMRARNKLRERRSAKAINMKLHKIVCGDMKFERMMDTIRKAVSPSLPKHVRDDVQQELVLGILSKRFKIHEAAARARKIITDTYGPRYLSLDTPIADGSGTKWIDTIADDRMHF